MAEKHKTFEDVNRRLARIQGHVGGIRRMWQDQRPCHEVLLQMAALRGAVERAARVIMRDHAESCVAAALKRGRGEEAVEELLGALERLM